MNSEEQLREENEELKKKLKEENMKLIRKCIELRRELRGKNGLEEKTKKPVGSGIKCEMYEAIDKIENGVYELRITIPLRI